MYWGFNPLCVFIVSLGAFPCFPLWRTLGSPFWGYLLLRVSDSPDYFHAVDSRPSPVPNSQLLGQALEVAFDCLHRKEQRLSQLLVRQPLCQTHQHFLLLSVYIK